MSSASMHHRGPLLAEIALALGGFALGTAEFSAMGVLPFVSTDLGVSVPTAGHLISAYALGVVVGAPLLSVVTAGMPRRMLLVGYMLLYALANAATAMLPGYHLVLLSRFIAGLPHGAYFGLAALVAASLVPPQRRASAIARVMLGLSVANIFGVPLATFFGARFGWRVCFGFVALIAATAAMMIRTTIPDIPAARKASPLRELHAFTRPQVWLTLLAGAVGFGGIFAVYSYITPLLMHVTHLDVGAVPWMLVIIGIGMTCGNASIGTFADHWLKGTMLSMYGFTMLVCIVLVWASANPIATAVCLFLIGVGTSVTTAFQSRLMDVAGDAQALAAALNHSAFNIANALGAWLGGVAITAGFGWQATGWVGAMLAMLGCGVLLVSFALDKRNASPGGRVHGEG